MWAVMFIFEIVAGFGVFALCVFICAAPAILMRTEHGSVVLLVLLSVPLLYALGHFVVRYKWR